MFTYFSSHLPNLATSILLLSFLFGTGPTTATANNDQTALELHPFPETMTLESLCENKTSASETAPVTNLPMFYEFTSETQPRLAFEVFSSMRHQISSAKPGIRRFSIWHVSEASWPYPQVEENVHILPPHSQIVRDFTKTNADFVSVTQVDGNLETGRLILNVYDIKNSKSTSSTVSWTNYKFPEAGTTAVEKIALACGWIQDEIAKSGIKEGAMSEETWKALPKGGTQLRRTDHGYFADMTKPTSYEVAMGIRFYKQWDLAKINDLIDKAPWDYRLIRAKINALDERFGRSKSALTLALALKRVMPEDIRMAGDIARLSGTAFSQRKKEAVTPAKIMETLADELTEIATSQPENWVAHLIAANVRTNFASAVRGTETIDKVSYASQVMHTRWNRNCMEHLEEIRRILGDDYAKLHRYMMDVRHASGTGPKPAELIAAAYKAEPTNPSTFLAAAYYNSIGWGDQRVYVKMIRAALQRHANHPGAMIKIYNSVGDNFARIPRFIEIEPDDLYKDPEGLGPAIVEQLKNNYPQTGLKLKPYIAEALYKLLIAHEEEDTANKLYADNQHFHIHLIVMNRQNSLANPNRKVLNHAAREVRLMITEDRNKGINVSEYESSLQLAEQILAKEKERVKQSMQ